MATIQTFQPLRVRISPTFWSELTRRKLEEYKLSDAAVPIRGFYRAGSAFMELDNTSFDKVDTQSSSAQVLVAQGLLHNCNTAEQFRTTDKKALLSAFARSVEAEPHNAENPSAFAPGRFLLVAYSDLKKHDFTYFIAVLAIRYKSSDPLALEPMAPFTEKSAELTAFEEDPHATWAVLPPAGDAKVRVAFKDPADDPAHPGWPLRLLMAHLSKSMPGAAGARAEVICVRRSGVSKLASSCRSLLTVKSLLLSDGSRAT